MVVNYPVGGRNQTWSSARAARVFNHCALSTAHLLPFLKSCPILETQATLWVEGWNVGQPMDVLDLETTAQMRVCSSVEGSQQAVTSFLKLLNTYSHPIFPPPPFGIRSPAVQAVVEYPM